MKYLLLLLMLFSSSCSAVRLSRQYEGINPEFKPYIQEFIYASQGKITKKDFAGLTMGFRKYKGGTSTIGTCWPLGYLTEIDINKDWWNRNHSTLRRQELVFHEFGHCILGRNHTEEGFGEGNFWTWIERVMFKIGIIKEKSRLDDGCPASIMHPYSLSDKCMFKHYLYYLDELFTEKNYKEFEKNSGHKMYVMVSCKVPKIVNKTKTWNDKDQQTLDRSKKVCQKRYGSCLKIFTKTEEQTYSAICE